jgi:short-subunit dehydrogenase
MSYTTKTHTTTYPSLSSFSVPANTTVLITGAGSGIGRATALSHARAGVKSLILLGRRLEPLASTAQLIESLHPAVSVSVYAVDILDFSALAHIFASHSVDAVVHAAGDLLPLQPIAQQDQEKLWSSFEINVRGTLNVALAFVKSIPDGKEGVFVGLNSAGVFMPAFGGVSAYLSSKLAAVKLLDSLAAENKGKLRVTHVHPGAIKTGMAELFERGGIVFPYDDISLPADFLVWVGSQEAGFLGGRYVFANWDVDELKSRKEEIEESQDLTVGLVGFPRV